MIKDSPLLRLLLRLVPILPGPELFDVVNLYIGRQRDIDQKVQSALDAISKSGQLVDELEGILKERHERLTKIQKEYADLSELVKVTQPQAEAVSNKLRDIMGKSQRTERIVALSMHVGVGLVFFFVGVFASDWAKDAPSKFRSYLHSSYNRPEATQKNN
jgi:hypothetical protein